jgi:hypothetical protein
VAKLNLFLILEVEIFREGSVDALELCLEGVDGADNI